MTLQSQTNVQPAEHNEQTVNPHPRLLHPLMGSDLSTLLRVISQNGPGRYPIHLSIIVAAALLRWPFSAYERWQVSNYNLPSANLHVANQSSPFSLWAIGAAVRPFFTMC